MHSIEDLIGSSRRRIDGAMEKIIPREPSAAHIRKACGPSRYEYDLLAAKKSIHDPVWELLDRGGKRWRPALFLLFCEAFGGKPEEFLDLAGIPEIAHNGTLIIDDIEDKSELRRGKPSVHLIHGTDIAINAGNAMYFLPLLAFKEKKGVSDKAMRRAYEVFVEEMTSISYGQGFDIYWHRNPSRKVSESQYLQMCAFKTGALSRMTARLAAVFAGATEAQTAAAGEFAESLGVAFQIRDDVLNLTADEGRYGKEIGGDITEGKKTLIVIHSLAHSPKKEAQRLERILAAHPRDGKRIREAISIVAKSGSLEYAQERAAAIVSESWKRFEGSVPESQAKKKLRRIAEYLVERDL